MTLTALLGQWSLTRYETPLPSGKFVCMTKGQKGTLEYMAENRMRVVIDREPAELQALGLNPRMVHLHYSGRFEVDLKKSEVYHHVEESDDPRRVGQTLVRHFKLQGDQLEISGIGLESTVKLIWVRAQ